MKHNANPCVGMLPSLKSILSIAIIQGTHDMNLNLNFLNLFPSQDGY